MIAKEHGGPLRLLVDLPEPGQVRLRWIDSADNVIWTEQIVPPIDRAYRSQVTIGSGELLEAPGHAIFVDGQGRKHHVIQAEMGQLGLEGLSAKP